MPGPGLGPGDTRYELVLEEREEHGHMGHPLIFHMEGILSSGAMEPWEYGSCLRR